MKFNPIYGLIGFIALLLLITPFSRVYQVNVFFLFSLVGAAAYASGTWVMKMLRDRGSTVIFMKDSVRRSHATGVISQSGETASTGHLSGLAAQPYGGFVVKAVNIADKNVAVVPAAATERLSPDTTLIYSPTSKLRHARLLKGVMSFFAISANAHPDLSFSTDDKSHSEARFGLINGLIMPITTDALAEQQRMVNQGKLTDVLEYSEGGEDSNRDMVQRMNRRWRKKPPLERAKAAIFGSAKTDSESERPSQREPQG